MSCTISSKTKINVFWKKFSSLLVSFGDPPLEKILKTLILFFKANTAFVLPKWTFIHGFSSLWRERGRKYVLSFNVCLICKLRSIFYPVHYLVWRNAAIIHHPPCHFDLSKTEIKKNRVFWTKTAKKLRSFPRKKTWLFTFPSREN